MSGPWVSALLAGQQADGGFGSDPYRRRARNSKTTPEVVDWGRAGEPNLMVTLNALRVLTAAGRVSVSD